MPLFYTFSSQFTSQDMKILFFDGRTKKKKKEKVNK